MTMQGRERRGLTDAERIELPDAVVLAIGVVELVHQQKDRLVAALEHAGDRLVLLGDSGAAVDHKQDDGGFLGGGERLVADGRGKDVVALERLDTARVDDGELAAVPIGRVIRAVARDAAGLVDDGVRGLGQAVNERGLAHVGASDDGDDRFHLLSLMGRVSGSVRVCGHNAKDALQGIEQLMRHGRHHMNLGAATGKACK